MDNTTSFPANHHYVGVSDLGRLGALGLGAGW